MAYVINRLKAGSIAGLRSKPGLHADGNGLYLQVRQRGASWVASWILRFSMDGRARYMGLGSPDTYTLTEARERAKAARQLIEEGIDPIDSRQQQAREAQAAALVTSQAASFRECAKRYIKGHGAAWKNAKHASQWENTLATYAYPTFGDLPAAAIDTPLVLKVLEPIWAEKPETANRLRGRIESILDWAKARGYREGENPARWRGHLSNLLPPTNKLRKVRHHAAMPYAKLGDFMAELRAREAPSARALEFTILTAARTEETIGAREEEFDLAAKIWTIPAGRMKAASQHRVPLSERAIEIIRKECPPGRVFPLSNMAMLMLLQGRMGYEELTVHGFRSTFRDWAASRTNFPREVIELSLAHSVKDKTEEAYWRDDILEKRRRLMNEWAKFCATPSAAAGNVTPLARRA